MSPDDVSDFKSFLAFVEALAADRVDAIQQEERSSYSKEWGPWANGWQNATIESFLEACAEFELSWRDRIGTDPEPSWRASLHASCMEARSMSRSMSRHHDAG